MAEDIQELNLEGSTTMESTALNVNRVGQHLESRCVHPFQYNVAQQVIQPVTEYMSHFASLKKMRRELKNITLQMDYHRQQVQKLVEKPSKNPLELTKARESLEKFQQQYHRMAIAP